MIAAAERRRILGIFAVREQHELHQRSVAAAVLTPANVLVLKLRYARGLKFQQIALATGSTEDAVIHMHDRSLEKMYDELDRRGIRKKSHI